MCGHEPENKRCVLHCVHTVEMIVLFVIYLEEMCSRLRESELCCV